MIVERLARAIGVRNLVKHDIDDAWGYTVEGSGEIRFYWHDADGPGGLESRVVDEASALIFLLVLASGLRLDVGRCPACVKRGGSWEWAYGFGTPFSPRVSAIDASDGWVWDAAYTGDHMPMSRPCPECSEPGPPVACGSGCEDGHIWICVGTLFRDDKPEAERFAAAYPRPTRVRQEDSGAWSVERADDCSACESTGKQPGPPQPAGRRILGAEAILEAMPRESLQGHLVGNPMPRDFFDRLIDAGSDACEDSRAGAKTEPGDQTVREALAVHADRLQANGDPLGELLAAWLAEDVRIPCGDGMPDDGTAPCCHEPCSGTWGTGCPHCHLRPGHRTCKGRAPLRVLWPKLEALAIRMAAQGIRGGRGG